MATRKRIGILTSGGDCPGLNCVIRAVVNHATLTHNWEVLGIPYATEGLLELFGANGESIGYLYW